MQSVSKLTLRSFKRGFAFGEPWLRSLCVQASFHTLAGTSFRTEKAVAGGVLSELNAKLAWAFSNERSTLQRS